MVYFTKKAWNKLARKFIGLRILVEETNEISNIFMYRSMVGKAHKALKNTGYIRENIDKKISFYEMTGGKSRSAENDIYFFGISDVKSFAVKFAKILEREGLVFVGLKETTGWQALVLTYQEQESQKFDFKWTNGIVSFADNRDNKIKPIDCTSLEELAKCFKEIKIPM